jgi:hypothetical protein
MMTVTSAQAAYNWLSQEAESAKSKRQAHYLFNTLYSAAKEDFGKGAPMGGLALEFWEPLTESLTGRQGDQHTIAFSAPLSDFLGELLADLAMRGERGAVSVEQAVMMLISALGWAEHFTLVPSGNHANTLQSDARLQRKYGVTFNVPISDETYADLHYCIG